MQHSYAVAEATGKGRAWVLLVLAGTAALALASCATGACPPHSCSIFCLSGGGACEGALDAVPPNANAYVCRCTCGGGSGFLLGRTRDVKVCVPPALNPATGGMLATPMQLEADCSARIQANALAMAEVVSDHCSTDSLFPTTCECSTLASMPAFNDANCNVPCPNMPLPLSMPSNSAIKTFTTVPPFSGCPARTTATPPVCQVNDADAPTPSYQGALSSFFSSKTLGTVTDGPTLVTIGSDAPIPTRLHGDVEFTGGPCPGESCDVGLAFQLSADAFSQGSFVESTDFIGLRLSGATAPRAIALDGSGAGVLPAEQVLATGQGTGVRRILGLEVGRETAAFTFTNTSPLEVNVDWSGGAFAVRDEFAVNSEPPLGAQASFEGTLVNQPPTARAGGDRVVECTSPAGARITLDGSATSDPEGNIVSFTWHRGVAFESPTVTVDPSLPTAVVQRPIGVETFSLRAVDAFGAIGQDQATVSVVDTAAPTLGRIELVTDCLWAPNHTLHLFRLGHEISANATDTCDVSPAIRIADVSSNQPVHMTGDGHTAPDIRFGTGAVCLRAERRGDDPGAREYTVTLEAVDASMNQDNVDVVIRVLHDESGERCTTGDLAPVVSDDDPRCTAVAPLSLRAGVTSSSASTPSATAPANSLAPEVTGTAGCSGAASSSPPRGPSLLLIASALALLRRRRARPCGRTA